MTIIIFAVRFIYTRIYSKLYVGVDIWEKLN
jgi:hypothetical protein